MAKKKRKPLTKAQKERKAELSREYRERKKKADRIPVDDEQPKSIEEVALEEAREFNPRTKHLKKSWNHKTMKHTVYVDGEIVYEHANLNLVNIKFNQLKQFKNETR